MPHATATSLLAFGKRAFRRPLSPDEEQRFVALYADERTRSDHAGSLGQIVETMLQSPKFLYRSELGLTTDGVQRKLTQYEVASELSYMFTASMPDDSLFVAADTNALQTPAQIEAHARRLLKLPTARTTLREFVSAYAGVSRFAELPKSAKVYPAFTPALRAAMQDETNQFIDGVLWEGDGTFKTLMSAPYSYLNVTLAKFYGVSDPGKGDTLVKTMLNPAQRAGLLTHASVLAAHSKTDESFSILRGKFVRMGLLCQTLPPPPKVVPPAPQVVPTTTTRERWTVAVFLFADVDILGTNFTFQQQSARVSVAVAELWLVRPSLALAFGWSG